MNATNVFICEPLLNTGLELQAISRVHRIGQTKPTTVWVYVMSGTVEESILRLATKRRLAMIGEQPASSFEEITLITESKLDTANSLELRIQGALVEKTAGGGEIVGSEDLWECLVVASKKRVLSTALEKEVKRHLFATAAESRIADTIELPLAGGPSTS